MGRWKGSLNRRWTPVIGRWRRFADAVAGIFQGASSGYYNPARITPSARCPLDVSSFVIGSFLSTDVVDQPLLIPECAGPSRAVTFSPQLVHGHGRGPPDVA